MLEQRDTMSLILDLWDELAQKAGDRWLKIEPLLNEKILSYESSHCPEQKAKICVEVMLWLEKNVPDLWQFIEDTEGHAEGYAERANTKRSHATWVDLKGDKSEEQITSHILKGDTSEEQIRRYSRESGNQDNEEIGELGRVSAVDAMAKESTELFTRYTDILYPKQVVLDTPRFPVNIRLTVKKPLANGIEPQALKLQEDVEVSVCAKTEDFIALQELEQTTKILPDRDSPVVVFEFRPRRVGIGKINFLFHQRGEFLGSSGDIKILVQERETSTHTYANHFTEKIGREVDIEPVDLALYISWEQKDRSLVFELRKPSDNQDFGRKFPAHHIDCDLEKYARDIHDRAEALTMSLDPAAAAHGKKLVLTPETVYTQLKILGFKLWEELFPREFRELYAKERSNWRDSSLMLVTDDSSIPWEIVWPYDECWEDPEPWCISMQMARWLKRDARGNGFERTQGKLPFRRFCILAPSDSELANARYEAEHIKKLATACNAQDCSPQNVGEDEVRKFLEEGTYDWMHAIAHGNFSSEYPNEDSVLWLENGRVLTSDAFRGQAIAKHLREVRPGFFFNACEVGRLARGLRGTGGWASHLLKLGAGLFLAPQWIVDSNAACLFAKKFYCELLVENVTVAEAVRLARMASRNNGCNITWASYSLYAHPNARIEIWSKQ
jgi:hypothetical protein